MALHFTAEPKSMADKGLRWAKTQSQREVDKLGLGELWQFSRSGTFLQKIHGQQFDPAAPSLLYWGGEILATGQGHVPEPGTIWLLAVAALALLGVRGASVASQRPPQAARG